MARILIVDDDATVNASLAAYLEDFDHLPVVAENGEDALEMLTDSAVELALIDLRLPGMNGEQLIVQLYERCGVRHFLIHTGAVHYSLPDSLLALGITPAQVLYKPLADLSLLLDAINRELSRQ
ncbi:response regulator [Motiliproteus sediminis]|uniref:response regulator n=1 Tax=Motiliproteus sediminis TaxID=1468178 RepID=UPI001AEFB8B5|nr:response regulator [Motiliproteus sediminis]